MQEIERKWLVTSIPPELLLQFGRPQEIEQGYFFIGKALVRLRAVKSYLIVNGEDIIRFDYYLTLKHGSGIKRQEVEVAITEVDFQKHWGETRHRRIKKKRFRLYLRGVTETLIELDVFQNNLEGLTMAEVEFGSLEKADAYSPPSWFGREVTESGAYSNSELAMNQCLPKALDETKAT